MAAVSAAPKPSRLRSSPPAALALLLAGATACIGTGPTETSYLALSVEAERAVVLLDGRELTAYQHGPGFAIPHLFPLTSPSGKALITQHPDPFPHHRALWLVDRVQAEGGPDVDFYHHWKNYLDADDPSLGHRHLIRHDELTAVEVVDGVAHLGAHLTWVTDAVDAAGHADPAAGTAVLDQTLDLRVRDLGAGEALLDLAWTLAPSDGAVTFKSDWIHYAWPYLRIDPAFAGEAGGLLLSDNGGRGQAGTNEQRARWIDYSNTVDGTPEGVTVFVVPEADGELPKWLTREYGTFGPRRVDALSGTGFTLAPGETLTGRAGLFVHAGDAEGADLAARYAEYLEWVAGDLP
ncbi:MAG: PmoA family protein [Planctomycetota bacterium]|nr:PmoA family protein [Planctomycetota bacterium]